MNNEQAYGNRFFRGLSDKELLEWRPKNARGWGGWSSPIDCQNVSAANREIRRRAKVGKFWGPYDWVEKMKATYSTSLAAKP